MTNADDSESARDPYMVLIDYVIAWGRDGSGHRVRLKCGHEAWVDDGELEQTHCDDCEANEQPAEGTPSE